MSHELRDDESPTEATEAPVASRRAFLKGAGTTAGLTLLAGLGVGRASAEEIGPLPPEEREADALSRRIDAAEAQSDTPEPALLCNGDEALYASRIGNFTKTLPHNELGEVDTAAYAAFLTALETNEQSDFDNIPSGGPGRLANPRAANAYSLGGADSHKIDMPAVHAFASARQAAEAGEVYWMAATRDVEFSQYRRSRLIHAAAHDMSRYSDFTGPRSGGRVRPSTLFRGLTPGDLVGPYISQFLYLDIPYGNRTNRQVARNPRWGDDYMTDYGSWLAVQRGQLPASAVNLRRQERYITSGRDLGEYVHRDYSYQAYLNAGLIALSFGPAALDPSPYATAVREGAFLTFGGAAILDLVARAAVVGLRPAWFHKWLVHRKLRPEAFGGRVHNHLRGAATYPIHAEFLDSPVLDRVYARTGTHLLPQAFPEGSPTHPSYPAGHATIAGACVTVLKAFFDETFEIPEPVEPSWGGRRLTPHCDDVLTLGGELNKLASNIALGRNMAGVHWRADGDDGLVAGETVAISLLQDYLRTVTEVGGGFGLTRFDGTDIFITADAVTLV